MVSAQQKDIFLRTAAMRIRPDEYGESTICNLYYDTPDFRLIRRSLERPVYKEKLRLRSYGQVAEGAEVFLELKKKYKGVVYKRRVTMTEEAAAGYRGGEAPPVDSQIGREIRYVFQYYDAIEPRVYLCYDRCAFFSREDPNLRITFDDHIRFRADRLRLTEQPAGEELLPAGFYLMEIKTAAGIPLWLTEYLTRNRIRKVSFSKYGTAYQRMLEREGFAALRKAGKADRN